MRRFALCIVLVSLVSLPVAAQEVATPTPFVETNLFGNVVVVQPGELGVLFNTQTGQLIEPLTPGTHNIDPASQQVTIYPTGQQEIMLSNGGSEAAVSARTLDRQQVEVELSIIYSLNPEAINLLHTRWGNRYAASLLVPVAHSAIRQVIATFTVEQLTTGGGSELESQIAAALRPELEAEGFALSNVFVRDLILSQAVTTGIEAQNEINTLWYRAQIESEVATMRAQTEMERLRLIGEQLANNPLLIFVIDGIQLASSAFAD